MLASPPSAFRLLVVLSALALGCSKHASEGAGGAKTLRLSMIPTTDPGKLARESEPLVAYLGQACVEPGMAKNTYGTGCFALLNTGASAMTSW